MSRLLAILLFLGFGNPIMSQNLSGKWTGYFTYNNGVEEKSYPYEVIINNANNPHLTATTITHFSNASSATAIASGMYTPNARLLNLIENKFEKLRLDANVQGCLMTNYLSYQNNNGSEVLQGTYTAKNAINGKDCGMGNVYLSRDLISLIASAKLNNEKKKVNAKMNNAISKNKITSDKKDSAKINNPPQPTLANLVQEVLPTKKDSSIQATNNTIPNLAIPHLKVQSGVEKHEHIILPWVLMSRENVIVKKIITHSKTASIELFDNGTIDNDTITIYDNKKLMVDRNRLSYKAIHVDFNFDDQSKEHEIILVANNLGDVPPNTALLVYKDPKQSEELFINTNFTKNAKLIIEYQPPINH